MCVRGALHTILVLLSPRSLFSAKTDGVVIGKKKNICVYSRRSKVRKMLDLYYYCILAYIFFDG